MSRVTPEQVNLRLKQHPNNLDDPHYFFEKNEFLDKELF
jgi:hypothetical protein